MFGLLRVNRTCFIQNPITGIVSIIYLPQYWRHNHEKYGCICHLDALRPANTGTWNCYDTIHLTIPYKYTYIRIHSQQQTKWTRIVAFYIDPLQRKHKLICRPSNPDNIEDIQSKAHVSSVDVYIAPSRHQREGSLKIPKVLWQCSPPETAYGKYVVVNSSRVITNGIYQYH